MNAEKLAHVLRDFGVDSTAFDVDKGLTNEAYCLTYEQDGWHLFYFERGLRTNERVFGTECDASDALILEVALDPSTRVQSSRHPPIVR